METLEQQQQTKSTPNIEPHAGDTETTPAASEEDEFEDNIEAFQLEKKEKNKRPQPELKMNKISVQNSIGLAIENGRSKEEPFESHGSNKGSPNSLDVPYKPTSINCVKIKSKDGKEVPAEEAAVPEEKPSASHVPLPDVVKLDGQKPAIDIKTEEECSLHGNKLKNNESSSPDVKIVEDNESGDEEINDDTANSSPAIKISENTSSQDEEGIDQLETKSPLLNSKRNNEAVSSPVVIRLRTSSADEEGIDQLETKSPLFSDKRNNETVSSPVVISLGTSSADEEGFDQLETKSPLFNDKRNNEVDSSPVVTNLATSSPDEEKITEEISSPVLIVDSQDEEISSPMVNIVNKASSSAAKTHEEEISSSPELKISEDIYKEARSIEDASPDDEREISSPVGETKEDPQATPAAEASPTASPVFKIDDLSPASIPDDEESLQDTDKKELSKVESQTSIEIIKIESDSDVEEVSVAKDKEEEKLPMETSAKIKINGAHTVVLEELNREYEEQNMEVNEMKTEEKEEEEALQLSVIASNAGNELQQNNSRLSSRTSSVSSTSQQLVIDHPESEQNMKKEHQRQQLLPLKHPQQQEVQQSLHATKRRRRSSNDNKNDNSKKQQVEEQSSLLMQRLQAPATNCHEMGKLLSCYKCNANNFDNFQQLNAHYAMCGQQREEGAATAAAAVAVASSHDSPPATAAAMEATTSPKTPLPVAAPSIKKERYFRCACCNTVHQCWNFFLHMREVHQRYICLYCSHVFPSVEKLSLHLENKHDMDQRHFNTFDAWQTLQTQEDRARYLVCCTCQASFERGTQFEDHDCAELMQPCALCGQKVGHANGCRNGSSSSNRKKTVIRRKRKTVRSKPIPTQLQAEKKTQPLEELPNWMGSDVVTQMVPQVVQQMLPQPLAQHENNIPAPSEDAPREDPLPKLVVPKIMLRVPKEFQKSVDAALSSTDTEDEENDELPLPGAAESSPASLLTVDAVNQQQQQLMLPASNRSDDTETATETASTFLEATSTPANVSAELEDDDSSTDKLTLMVAELERTKRHIERTKAHILAKQEQQLQQQQQFQQQPPFGVAIEQQQEELQHQEELQQQRRWSPTPPASPHNNHINIEEKHVPKEEEMDQQNEQLQQSKIEPKSESLALQRRDSLGSDCMDIDDSLTEEQQVQPEQPVMPVAPLPPADGIEVACEGTHTIDLQLDRPLDRFELVEFVRLCLKAVYPFCLYCNHARRIAVNAKQLVLHLIGEHRFTATVDSITAEELHAETIVTRLKSYLPVVEGGHYLNSASCCSLEDGRFALPFNERVYECFQCRYVTATHKELYTHNRRLHAKSVITCGMCRINFFSYSELLCHICPGVTTSNIYDVQFRCCLCETSPTLPSAFRLMVHLRKQHQTCDICLEDCHTQAKLSAHVWKHKLLHLCYRCGIAYRNKQDISKHLFWKHGTESASCKRCLQKRWRHVYHFCVPATEFTCEHCLFSFSKAIYLEVHKREHVGDFRYACTEEQCEEKFVSRKLLLKHAVQHEVKESPANGLEAIEGTQTPQDEEQRQSRSASEQPENDVHAEEAQKEAEQRESMKSEATDQLDASGSQQQAIKDKSPQPGDHQQQQQQQQTTRKRRKKSKRNKASLEDLNLIAPNLSESDSSDDSDSDAAQTETTHATLPMRSSVDDLDMPRVMLSPASESDNDEADTNKELVKSQAAELETKEVQDEQMKQPKEENQLEAGDKEEKPKLETNSESAQEVADIWKNLLQNQPATGKTEETELTESEPTEEELRPSKLHVVYSDHDYCKMLRTPLPTPVPSPKKLSRSTPNKSKRGNASSDSDSSSSSSSNSDSDSSSCSCGSNCSCSSSGSSSSDDDSDNESTNSRNAKKAHKKTSTEWTESNNTEEDVNVTSINEEEPRPETPTPKAPLYNESDFDTSVSDTDEEFYDAHPQRMANELLAQKRQALMSAQAPGQSSNYDIVENSRPSTPSLPEEATAFADKRERGSKNKKRKRERKSTCKSTSQAKLTPEMPPLMVEPQQLLPHFPTHLLNTYDSPVVVPAAPFQLQQQQQLLPDANLSLTPLTHRPGWQPRMSEGSSCSDADGQLKRSKRTRRPNKFYGYTSDDENMSSVLAPPLQVGMQLIKPQPPPQLTWAKEDLPTPPKHQRSRNNHSEHNSNHHHHQHSNSNGSTRKRNRRTPQSGLSGSAKRSAKRVKQQPLPQQQQPEQLEQPQPQHLLPPIPTLKIRPALLPASIGASDSSDSSSDDDENAEINVTSVLPLTVPRAPPMVHPVAPPPAPLALPAPPPPPPPATRAFNQPIPPALLPNPDFATLQYFKANNIRYPIRPPAGARLAREGESVYCYCRCPYDEVSEMIACDGDNCLIEWFHFECVGIMVAPQGKWFCAECRPKYSEGLYLGVKAK